MRKQNRVAKRGKARWYRVALASLTHSRIEAYTQQNRDLSGLCGKSLADLQSRCQVTRMFPRIGLATLVRRWYFSQSDSEADALVNLVS